LLIGRWLDQAAAVGSFGYVAVGSTTAKLEQLRPVTFHLKTDPHGALQYGIA
jgi:hypothetical protein